MRQSKHDNRRFYLLQFLRAGSFILLLALLGELFDLGTPSIFLAISSALGVLFAGYLLKRGASFIKTVIWHGAVFGAGWLCFKIGNAAFLTPANPHRDFEVYRLALHISLIGLVYAGSFLSTWAFWVIRHALTAEIILIGSAVIWFLSSHRNYRLDAPKAVSNFAWWLGFEAQYVLLGIGIAATLFLGAYLAAASDRRLFKTGEPLKSAGRPRKVLSFLAPTVFLLIFAAYAAYVNQTYSAELSRASEGVGENKEQGKSPLGFHSAVGKTKQPAALVRLEGDYKNNPWSPMLYIREGALSEFNGKELVLGSNEFDTDVPRVSPGQPYLSLDADPGPSREKLTYSIYLLIKHTTAIAVDFPRSMRLIRNPDPQRFVMSYQALSFAPSEKIESIIDEPSGDDKWSKQIWEHYLRAPGSQSAAQAGADAADAHEPVLDNRGEDLRYTALSKRLTGGAVTDVEKAAAIVSYLTEQSIYTRQPGHQATANGDPVAPYLFAEKKRGYCVHFAHAAVYLMRLAGIPARIGTGYLTDLTYAKDGHVLLQMGDRHAWPEVYIRGHGWVVFDVTPQQAENEQVLVPDEKLLDELMSKLDPAEEFAAPPPPDEQQTKPSLQEVILAVVLRKEYLMVLLAALAGGWMLIKGWLRLGYLLTRNPRRRAVRAYTSFASLLADIGVMRNSGETRREFARRVQDWGVDWNGLTVLNEAAVYSGSSLAQEDIRRELHASVESFNRSRSRWRRLVAFFSPLSLGRLRRW